MKTYLCRNYKKAKEYFRKLVAAPTISEVIEQQKKLLEKEIAECAHVIHTTEFIKYMATERLKSLETWEQSEILKQKGKKK